MFTNTFDLLRDRLAAAQKKEKAARAEAARIRREMKGADRRRETQRLCTLGRAWLALGERSPGYREPMLKFLGDYIIRDSDREILTGTTWELPAPVVAEPAEQGGDHV